MSVFRPTGIAKIITATLLLLLGFDGKHVESGASLRRRLTDSLSISPPGLSSGQPQPLNAVLERGDLPSYTGWARPETSDYQMYHLKNMTSPIANQALRLRIVCDKEGSKCKDSKNAHFYARMYGPAVLAGHVTAIGNGQYEVAFFPQDAGVYWIEVVLTFSSTPAFVEFPVREEPGYEGYLLPGFPLQTIVDASSTASSTTTTNQIHLPLCSAKELSLGTMFDGISVGRWKVVNKHAATTESPLGITMDYQPRASCSIAITPTNLDRCLYSHVAATYKPLRIILVGDSVMRLQYQQILDMNIPGVELSYIYAGGGLAASLKNVTTQLTSLIDPDEERAVLFNSGLHDILALWNQMHNITKAEGEYYRTYHYRQNLKSLTDFLSTYPASSKVFQLTTAAWPKWGNWGFRWPAKKQQPFVMSTHWAEHYNRIAMHVLEQLPSSPFQIMDAYWMTLARPDNRELSEKGKRAKLAHPGTEVMSAIVRTYVTMVISNLGCFTQFVVN